MSFFTKTRQIVSHSFSPCMAKKIRESIAFLYYLSHKEGKKNIRMPKNLRVTTISKTVSGLSKSVGIYYCAKEFDMALDMTQIL